MVQWALEIVELHSAWHDPPLEKAVPWPHLVVRLCPVNDCEMQSAEHRGRSLGRRCAHALGHYDLDHGGAVDS